MSLFCSTIIPTIGRPELSRAVESVINQEFTLGSYEIIVVNDSGKPLPKAEWQESERVRVINTNRRERSVARNAGAAIANGRYLHFLDDDDWLAPNALQHLWELGQSSDAKWLYGITQLVDRRNNPLIQLRHEMNGNCFIQVLAGEWIPLQASFIEARTFFKVGGFSPLISGPEDIDLLRRIALVGDIAETTNLIAYIVRGKIGSSTDYSAHPQLSRWAREFILEEPDAFRRMRLSAKSNYFYGRIVRAYITSAVWNIQHRRLFSSASMLTYCFAAMLFAGSRMISFDFWGAVVKAYKNETFSKGLREVRELS